MLDHSILLWRKEQRLVWAGGSLRDAFGRSVLVILRTRKRPFAETGKRSSKRSNSNEPQNVSPLEALSAHVYIL
jgi:hypothetical protein